MPNVDVKQAVESATAYLSKLLPVQDVRLEEVEISDDDRFWYVTLSGLVPVPKDAASGLIEAETTLSALGSLFKMPFERVYKVFTVDSAFGSVRSMKIRKME